MEHRAIVDLSLEELEQHIKYTEDFLSDPTTPLDMSHKSYIQMYFYLEALKFRYEELTMESLGY